MSHRSSKYGAPIVFSQDRSPSVSSYDSRSSYSSTRTSGSSSSSSTYTHTSKSSSSRSYHHDDLYRDPHSSSNVVDGKSRRGHKGDVVVINNSSRTQTSQWEPKPEYGHSYSTYRETSQY